MSVHYALCTLAGFFMQHIAKCTFVLVNTILFAGSAAVLLNAVQLSYIGRGGSCITVLMLLPLVSFSFAVLH